VPFNDVEALGNVFAARRDAIAAVIVEPVAANMGVATGDGFCGIRELCTPTGRCHSTRS
jgi:glutamate-1-semialdehyde aminotransferase